MTIWSVLRQENNYKACLICFHSINSTKSTYWKSIPYRPKSSCLLNTNTVDNRHVRAQINGHPTLFFCLCIFFYQWTPALIKITLYYDKDRCSERHVDHAPVFLNDNTFKINQNMHRAKHASIKGNHLSLKHVPSEGMYNITHNSVSSTPVSIPPAVGWNVQLEACPRAFNYNCQEGDSHCW